MLKEFSKYTISNILVRATGFIIPFVLAYYYTQEEYGVISLGYAYLNFFSMFYAFGFCESVQRFYYELRDTDQREIFGNIILFDFFLVSCFSILFTILYFVSTFFDELPKSIFLMILFIGYLKSLQNIGLSFLQMEQKSSKYVTVSLISVISDVILVILFVVVIHLSVEFRFISLLICNFISSILIIFYIKNYIKKPKVLFPLKFIEVLKFALPCMCLPIMSWLLTTSDKIVMSKLGTMSDVGIYSFCFSLAQLPTIIQQGFNTAYTPIFYSEYENHKKIKSIQTLFIELYAFVLMVFIIFIFIFFKYIYLFEKYATGLVFIPYFLIATLFSAISTMNNSHLAYSYNTKITLLITAITGPISILFNYFFISKLQSMGAAISVAVTMSIQMFLSFLCSIKFGYFAWNLKRLIVVFIFFFVGIFMSNNIYIFTGITIIYAIYILISKKKILGNLRK